MGLRKVKIQMDTVMQKDRVKESINFDEFFMLTDKFIQCKKLEGLRVRTIENYETTFRYCKEFAYQSGKNRGAVTEDFFRDYIYYMTFEKSYSPFTVNIRLRTIKTYLNWLYSEKYINNNLSLKIKLLKTPVDKVQPMANSDIKRLLDTCDFTTYTGFRDFCVIILILDTGIRVGELVQLVIDDVDIKNCFIRVRSEVSKTVTERCLPIGKKTAEYLNELIKIAKSMNSEYIFQSTYGGQIKKQNLELSFRRLADKAGVKGTLYQIRHTFATNAVKQGMSLFHLQKIMGHSVLQTTRQYVQLDNDELKQAHDRFSIMNEFI